MLRLPAVSGREVVRALCRAGYAVLRQSGSHVILAHPATDVTVSVPVHGGRDMKRSLLHGIIADAGLSAEEFAKLLR